MSIEGIALPKGITQDAEKLHEAILQAGTAEQLNRAAGKAEGFVLALECGKLIKSQIAEKLYVAYDDAASQRLAAL